MKLFFLLINYCLFTTTIAQSIGSFTSLAPIGQTPNLILPNSHSFQLLIQSGDSLTSGGILGPNNDFTGYVPIGGSSQNGYLGINSEFATGGLAILDINYTTTNKLWQITISTSIDFSSVGGTTRNCSGTVTPWNTLISCEEAIDTNDNNNDGYHDMGWCVEIDPISKQVIDKRWSLGNFKHENIVVHSNQKTVYQGADSNPGYLYKFVADSVQDLSQGTLYVYQGSKNGSGNWILITNSTPQERNSTLMQSNNVNATVFNGIEDVEISPDGWVYFAVKGDNQIYRFLDIDPITGTGVSQMETYVGNQSYDIVHQNGITNTNWGVGNDNLAFDNQGNLWVQQDGSNNYIWVVDSGHTQANPKVRIFASLPNGSEPTGLTFSPDYNFMFFSIQHPSGSNISSTQLDATGLPISFHKSSTVVAALKPNLGTQTITDISPTKWDRDPPIIAPNPFSNSFRIDWSENYSAKIKIYSVLGLLIESKSIINQKRAEFNLIEEPPGLYFIKINSNNNSSITLPLIKK